MPSIIDADLHIDAPRIEALFPYLEEHWVEHLTNTMFKGPVQHYYPRHSPIAARGPSLEGLREEVLDPRGVEDAADERRAEPHAQ